MNMIKKSSVIAVALGFSLGLTGLINAATSVGLGTASTYAVIGGSTITNTGATVVNGDLGLSPGTSVTGFPPGTVTGTQHIADAAANQAQIDLVAAYNNAAGQTPVSTVPTELGGTTKTAGIYNSAAGTFGITGTLTLDGQGNAGAVFIFKTASTLITAGSSSIVLINGAQACNVFWQVGSSATLGTSSTFKGSIFALTAITLTTGANVEGRVLARNAAVTLDTNVITTPVCITAAAPLINVTKTPTPTSLPSGPGSVTYNYVVTNIGTVPMSTITVTDNRCTTVTFISGDTDGDSQLDLTETWRYRCTMTLSQTTTNTVTATGVANGLTASDTDTATVVVTAPPTTPTPSPTPTPTPPTTTPNPAFPAAGIAPDEEQTSWSMTIPATMLIIVSLSFMMIKIKRFSLDS